MREAALTLRAFSAFFFPSRPSLLPTPTNLNGRTPWLHFDLLCKGPGSEGRPSCKRGICLFVLLHALALIFYLLIARFVDSPIDPGGLEGPCATPSRERLGDPLCGSHAVVAAAEGCGCSGFLAIFFKWASFFFFFFFFAICGRTPTAEGLLASRKARLHTKIWIKIPLWGWVVVTAAGGRNVGWRQCVYYFSPALAFQPYADFSV